MLLALFLVSKQTVKLGTECPGAGPALQAPLQAQSRCLAAGSRALRAAVAASQPSLCMVAMLGCTPRPMGWGPLAPQNGTPSPFCPRGSSPAGGQSRAESAPPPMSREDGAAGDQGRRGEGTVGTGEEEGRDSGDPPQSDCSSASSWLVKLLPPGLVLLVAPLPAYTALRTCSPHPCWGAMAQKAPEAVPCEPRLLHPAR